MLIDNHNISELSTNILSELRNAIDNELYNREKANREDAMTQLWQLIEKIQAKKYNIILMNSKDEEFPLNDICSVYDTEYDTGWTFNFGENMQEYFDELDKRTKIEYDEDGNIICPHIDDRVYCDGCEIQKECWEKL
jgi:hypothetical protein